MASRGEKNQGKHGATCVFLVLFLLFLRGHLLKKHICSAFRSSVVLVGHRVCVEMVKQVFFASFCR